MTLAGLLVLGLLAADSARAELAERIVFRRDSGDLNQIYVMRASDGFIQRKLSTSDTDEYDPAWSPDAIQIAFGSVWAIAQFGTTKVFTNPQINVASYDDFHLPASPTSLSFFQNGFKQQNYSPSWSPDPEDVIGRIYAMNSNDGSGVIDISANEFDNFDPDWSPDGVPIPNSVPEPPLEDFEDPILGELIAFASFRNGNSNIYVMRPDGQPFDDGDSATLDDLLDGPKDIQLTTTTSPATHNFGPAWSPDGTRIAFTSNRNGSFDIYVMENDGSDPQRLTDNPAVDDAPTWSPDGTQIAFSSDRDGNSQIYVMNVDGSNPRNLSKSNTNDYEPSWSLVPVPEPGASAALATALAVLLGLRAGRRQAD